MRANKSIDTDVLSAGFARLLSAGHLQRLGRHDDGQMVLSTCCSCLTDHVDIMVVRCEFEANAGNL
jgi:hypothetical protein